MKVRLSASHIRVRVNLDDVAQWQQAGCIELTIPWIQHHWKLELCLTEETQWQTPDAGASIWRILVPKSIFIEWIQTDQESIEHCKADIRISIEKDYPCEHRLGEETRKFTRPHETH